MIDIVLAKIDERILAAKWLEKNGNARGRHAARMVRFSLETLKDEIGDGLCISVDTADIVVGCPISGVFPTAP